MHIVSLGEVMVEMAPTDVSGRYAMSFAGDTFNTAWYLARLRPDWRVDYMTGIGTDALSDQFVDFANAAGIGTDRIIRASDRTLGLYLIELDNGERSFHYWRGQSAARSLADDPDRLSAGLRGADWIFLSGITLAILAPEDRAALLEVLAKARTAGAQIAFDPNIRSRLWEDMTTARAAITQAAFNADLLLPSFEEEAETFGDDAPTSTIARYRERGVARVIVKNSGGPVHFADEGGRGSIKPVPLDSVVDTTAAGDSFNAGVLTELLAGQSMERATEMGCQLARAVIGHRGALVPFEARLLC